MKSLPKHWHQFLLKKGETGMGYQIATVKLRDGTSYRQVIIDSGFVTRVRGFASVPFDPADIVEIEVTHDKWDWNKETA